MDAELKTPEIPALGLVKSLSGESRRMLSSYGEFLPVHANQILIEEGRSQHSLYLLISGLLHATSSCHDIEVLLGRILPGESIGEINIFNPGEASATVKAIQFSQVWRIDRKSLEQFMNNYPLPAAQLLVGITSNLSRRLRSANKKLSTEQGKGEVE